MNALIEAMTRTDVPSQELDVDFDTLEDALRQIRDRFIDERVKGWTHPETGKYQAPVSPEQAEQRWNQVRSKFAQIMLRGRNEPDVDRRLRTGDKPGRRLAASDYSGGGSAEFQPPDTDWGALEKEWQTGPGERAMRDEPSLRRGESRAAQQVRKMIGA